jgi:hypothetical protein
VVVSCRHWVFGREGGCCRRPRNNLVVRREMEFTGERGQYGMKLIGKIE